MRYYFTSVSLSVAESRRVGITGSGFAIPLIEKLSFVGHLGTIGYYDNAFTIDLDASAIGGTSPVILQQQGSAADDRTAQDIGHEEHVGGDGIDFLILYMVLQRVPRGR